MSNDVQRAKYHFYLTDPSGNYVNAAGAVVTRDFRVARPAATRFQDVAYNTPVYNPVAEVFHPGNLATNSLSIAQNGDKTNFLTTVSHQKQDGVLRDHGGYDRTDVRINLDHRPRDDVQFSLSGYHARSNREELDGNFFFDLTATAPDVNLLLPDPDGTKYIFQPDPQGVHPNPLYLAATQQNFTHRVRTLGSADLSYTPLSWLSADANASYDRSDQNQSFFLDRGLKSENQALGDPGSLTLYNAYTSSVNASGSASLLKDFGRLTARTTGRALMEQQKFQDETGNGDEFRRQRRAAARRRAVAKQLLVRAGHQRPGLFPHRRSRLRRSATFSTGSCGATAARSSGQVKSGIRTIAAARPIAWRRSRGGRGSE